MATGLSSIIEDALWARAQARQDILNERTYGIEYNYDYFGGIKPMTNRLFLVALSYMCEK